MRRTVTLPAASVLAIAGGIGWLVGCGALEPGVGTVLLAAGLGLTIWLVIEGRRSADHRPIESWRTRRLLRLVVIGIILSVAASAVLGFLGFGELVVPAWFGIVGVLLLPASSALDSRSYVLIGAVLMLLAAGGWLLALNTAGESLPRGVVGMGAAVVLWLAAAHRAELFFEIPARVRDWVNERRDRTDRIERDPTYGRDHWYDDGHQDQGHDRRWDRGPDTKQF